MAIKTCTWHCTTCDAHFHSVGAFDGHRQGGGKCNLGAKTAKGRELLQVWTTEGHCDKMAGCWVDGHRDHHVSPVMIYQEYGSAYTGPA